MEEGRPGGRSYRRVYALSAPAGACLLQRVQVTVRSFAGRDLVSEYLADYAEWFAPGAEPARDVHDFAIGLDGWTPRDLLRLLQREGLAGRRDRLRGAPRLECSKSFTLGAGRVEAPRPILSHPQRGEFGFLLEGPGGPSRASLRLCFAGQERLLTPPSPFPFGAQGAGRGEFVGAPGWLAQERWEYHFATERSTWQGEGYAPWAAAGVNPQ